jgi:PleD family two-component response regulator
MTREIKRVFYTDDDEDDHMIFALALKEVDPAAHLHSFLNCGEIINYLKDENMPLPDIIFLDQNMPGNSGNECLAEIKRIARMERIPVVMYTTGGNPNLVGNALELGAYKYVIKPTFHQDVKQNLSSIISECEKLP